MNLLKILTVFTVKHKWQFYLIYQIKMIWIKPKIKVVKAPTGLHDIIFDYSSSKDYYFSKGFEEIEVV